MEKSGDDNVMCKNDVENNKKEKDLSASISPTLPSKRKEGEEECTEITQIDTKEVMTKAERPKKRLKTDRFEREQIMLGLEKVHPFNERQQKHLDNAYSSLLNSAPFRSVVSQHFGKTIVSTYKKISIHLKDGNLEDFRAFSGECDSLDKVVTWPNEILRFVNELWFLTQTQFNCLEMFLFENEDAYLSPISFPYSYGACPTALVSLGDGRKIVFKKHKKKTTHRTVTDLVPSNAIDLARGLVLVAKNDTCNEGMKWFIPKVKCNTSPLILLLFRYVNE